MNAKQKNEIIKMYAETIENEPDIKRRIRQIEKLKDMFSAEIEDWENLLYEYANKKSLVGVISAIEVRSGHTPSIPKSPPIQEEEVHRSTESMPIYKFKSQEQLDAELKEFNERRMRYVMLMSAADSLYRQNHINLETYYAVQDVCSEYYGFKEKESLFFWNGPHKGEPVKTNTPKKSRTYTRRNTEYWEEYEKKHKK